MGLIGNFTKMAGESLDYEVDLEPELSGDKIVGLSWSSTPPSLIVGNGRNGMQPPAVSGYKATVWLGGGLAGKFYTVNARIVTAGGRVLSRGFGVKVESASAADGIVPVDDYLARPSTLSLGLGQVPDPGPTLSTIGPSSMSKVTQVVLVIIVIIVIALFLWWLLSDDKPQSKKRPSIKKAGTPTLAREVHHRLERRGDANPTVLRSLRSHGAR